MMLRKNVQKRKWYQKGERRMRVDGINKMG